MADRREIGAVYAAGIVQGLALVTFPAASTIFTSASFYGLSSTAYGELFLPQALMSITASLMGARLSHRWGIKYVFVAGVLANLLAMLVLVSTQLAMTNRALVYVLLLVATGSLGVGFGLTVPSLNTFVAAFFPSSIERAVLALNALLGLGTVLAPVLVAAFIRLGNWSGLPLLVGVLLAALALVSSRLRLQANAQPYSTTATTRGARPPARFWMFAGFAVLYGIVETMSGTWGNLLMVSDLGAPASDGSLALTSFWGMVTVGRVASALLSRYVPERLTFQVLPWVAAGALASIAVLPGGSAAFGIFAFGLAGLGCSALLPLTISFGQEALAPIAASVAGYLVASYQVGYAIAAFGVGPLQDSSGLQLHQVFGAGAVVAVAMAVVSFVVARHQRATTAVSQEVR